MSMGPIDSEALKAKDKALAKILAEDGYRATILVNEVMDDAENAAVRAITGAAKKTRDGRMTIAEIRQTRGFITANKRIESLSTKLIELVKGTRTEAYLQAYTGWCEALPKEALAHPNLVGPTGTGLSRFLGSPIQGITLAIEVSSPERRSQDALLRTLAQAAQGFVRESEVDGLIGAWSDRVRAAYLQTAQACLQDAVTRADYVAQRDAIKPELLHVDPTHPGA